MCPAPNGPRQAIQSLNAFNNIEKELSAEGIYALAYWLDDASQTEAALEYYRKALQVDPGLAEAHYNMGVIYNERQEQTKAVQHLVEAIRMKPQIAESYSALGMIWCGQNRFDEALVLVEQALSINPHFAEAHYHMGLILQQMGEYHRGRDSFQKAMVCKPGFAPARWLYLLSLPMMYETADQIDLLRRQFSRNLDQLGATIKLDTPQQIQHALAGVRTATNFYLQYQGRNDRELQMKYGRLVHAVMSAGYPQWRNLPAPPTPQRGEKIRIGYVSSFMCRHTIGTFLAGWIENHNRAEFQVHCYHVGEKADDLTAFFRKTSHRFYHLPGDIETTAARIVSDRLHILVYSDIGMHTETLQLAAMRLAPVQCKGWGHPVTTGLPTIDYYLGSDLMEPDHAEQHYSETLVRLPNLALYYRPPQLPANPKTRADLGLPDDRFIFLSPQSIFKYLPQHDDIYAAIAKEAPASCFVFISHQSRFATRRFRDRLREAFKRYHLDADRFCIFSPRLGADEFLSLNMAADVLLDTFEWSGGKTTLEAISCGLPVVTCPGRFMRGRHAMAMLKMMSVTGTIARDRSAYCRIAVRLATDATFHARIKADFMAQRHKLYRDNVFSAALERFYRSLVWRLPKNAAENDRKKPAMASRGYRKQ